ncbi:MAG: vWA domain-containing protein [Planctomycetota bacterium]
MSRIPHRPPPAAPPSLPQNAGPPPLPSIEEDDDAKKPYVAAAIAGLVVFVLLLLWMLMAAPEPAGNLATGNVGSGAGGQGDDQGDDGNESGQGNGKSPAQDANGDAAEQPSGVDARPTTTAGGPTTPSEGPSKAAAPERPASPNENVFFVPTPAAEPAKPAPPTTPAVAANGGGDSAEFFGSAAEGQRIAYAVDLSSSMAGRRFERARDELLRSVQGLDESKSVYVVFFNSAAHPQPQDKLIQATNEAKREIEDWVTQAAPSGGTMPEAALRMAIGHKPDVLFVLSDGEFHASVVYSVTQYNRRFGVQIQTIGFQFNAATLRELAELNGGTFRLVN